MKQRLMSLLPRRWRRPREERHTIVLTIPGEQPEERWTTQRPGESLAEAKQRLRDSHGTGHRP